MAISMLKIRRPLGRLIFNMGIAIPGKTVFLIETAPSFFEPCHCKRIIFCMLCRVVLSPYWSLVAGEPCCFVVHDECLRFLLSCDLACWDFPFRGDYHAAMGKLVFVLQSWFFRNFELAMICLGNVYLLVIVGMPTWSFVVIVVIKKISQQKESQFLSSFNS